MKTLDLFGAFTPRELEVLKGLEAGKNESVSRGIRAYLATLTPEEMDRRLRNSLRSKESCRRSGLANKERWAGYSKEEKRKVLKGTFHSEEAVGNRREGIRKYHSKLSSEEEKVRAENSFLSPEGRKNAIESGREISHRRYLRGLSRGEMEIRMKKSCHSPEGIRHRVKAQSMKPNGLEAWVSRRLQGKFPAGEWAYSGDYSQGISIGLKIPDFVNNSGKKEVIETLGGLGQHHFLEDEGLLVEHYAKYGYKCHVVWEWDAYNPEELDKISGRIR